MHSVIFTSGCTGALKLLAETFPWSPASEQGESQRGGCGSIFCFLQDNHTSVIGMREVARASGAQSVCLSPSKARSILLRDSNTVKPSSGYCNGVADLSNHLFVYPGQSNFSGCKYPEEWASLCKNGDLNDHLCCHGNWSVLLDAASMVTTSTLDLTTCEADFISLSFYKMFGFPTGLGALIARKDALALLRKKFYGGGAVMSYSATQPFFVPRKLYHEW